MIQLNLIVLAQSGDQIAISELMDQCEGLIYMVAKRYLGRTYVSDPNLLFEDLIQAGRIGIWRALKDYTPERAKFTTYAVACIASRMWDEIRKQRRQNSRQADPIYDIDIEFKTFDISEDDRLDRIRDSINLLDDRRKKIIKEKFGIETEKKSQKVLALEKHVSVRAIAQTQRTAIKQLRKLVNQSSL